VSGTNSRFIKSLTEIKYKNCHFEKVKCIITVKKYEKCADNEERAAQIDQEAKQG
jgi:hypothetical protein